MAEEIRIREFAPEMNAIRQYFDRPDTPYYLPQLPELLERLLNKVNPVSVEEIRTTINNIISGEQAVGGDGSGPLVDWLLNSVYFTTARRVNIESESPNLIIRPPPFAGDLMEYFFTVKPGGAVAPFTRLFEWNGVDFSQFQIDKTGTWDPDVIKTESDQGTGNFIRPYVQVTAPTQAGVHDHFMYTKNPILAISGQDLWIVFDVAQINGLLPEDNTGLLIGKAATPTTDHYHLGITSSGLRLNKFIAGTRYLQAGNAAFSLGGGDGEHSRVNVVVKPTGRCIVSTSGGASGYRGRTFRTKMTISEPTKITSTEAVKVGFRVRSPDGTGNTLIWSHLAVYSAPPEAEQLRP